MDTIDRLLGEADQAWRGYGVGSADRATLAADLRLDLRAAANDGGDPAQLIGGDVAGFARRLADEAGVRRVRGDYGRVVGTALIGAVLGAVLGYGLLEAAYPVFVHLIDIPRSIDVPIQLAVAVAYGTPGAVVAAGAVVAVRTRLRALPEIRRTARLMSVLVPVAGIVITPITVGFAWATDYSLAPSVVLTEIAMVLGAIAGATALARRLSLREARTAAASPHPETTRVKPA
ncbi:hypothetical protein ACGFH8_03190 [Micromonospora sp. NPDC049175]|uniref:hypothetical protein n=1 Tax=Micromonospora sp. NPDC049175 TaxID=3364266 RepID=UPI003711482C